MDRENLLERIRHAKERAQKFKGEHQRLEGRLKHVDRKRDARRKIWAGGWLLKAIQSDAELREKLKQHLRTANFRKGEQDLFADLLDEKTSSAPEGGEGVSDGGLVGPIERNVAPERHAERLPEVQPLAFLEGAQVPYRR
jgi:hypothetical protein